MCNENKIEILGIDFVAQNDEVNWFSSSINPLTTNVDGLLLLPDSTSSIFARNIGQIDVAKNRINVRLNLKILRPNSGGNDTSEYLIQVLNGNDIVGQNTIHINNLNVSDSALYFFDRTYKYDNLSGNISVRIKIIQGVGNYLFLKNIKVDNYFYCQENVRTYFVIDGLLEDSLGAQSSAIKLNSYKIDDIETLTPAFFSYNNSNLGGPASNWNYAKANLDGSDRIAESATPLSFNPFVNEFGLVFNTVGAFHGCKPIATYMGQDFGVGIMNFGFEKPVILNAYLQEKKGCFFIDIDYTKNLYIELDVLVNNTSTSVYNNPTTYRRYYITFDKTSCEKHFFYLDKILNNNTPIDNFFNGFLSGITAEKRETTAIPCSQSVNYTGEQGVFEYILDFGTQTGMCGIAYNAYGAPDRFEITWDSTHVDSGYVGLDSYNQQLINNNVDPSIINTTLLGSGNGQLLFMKNTAYPTTAVVKVSAVLANTAWEFSGICPI